MLCGSAATLEGIDMLLDALVDHLPSAWEAGAETAEDKDGNPVEIACTDEAPLAAYIFKTVADPFVGKLSYFKVVAGKLSNEIAPVNSRTGEPERLGKLIYMTGKKRRTPPSSPRATSARSPSCRAPSPATPSATPSGWSPSRG